MIRKYIQYLSLYIFIISNIPVMVYSSESTSTNFFNESDDIYDEYLFESDLFNSSSYKDPFKPVNKIIFYTYKSMYDYGGIYLTNIYIATPSFFRERLTSFKSNLYEPINIINHILQFRINAALESTFRFIFNTTFGLFGFWDVMEDLNMKQKHNDFGATAYMYGIPNGPNIFFFGHSNLRDTLGNFFNLFFIDYYFPQQSMFYIGSNTLCSDYFSCAIVNPNFGKIRYPYFKIAYPTLISVANYSILYEENKFYFNSSLDPYTMTKMFFEARRDEELKKIKSYN